MKSTVLNTVIDKIGLMVRGMRFMGQIALISMVITICYDVIMRYVFAKPTMWCLEVNTFLIVFLAVIPAGDVLLSKNHLRISFLPDRMSAKIRKLQFLGNSILGMIFCLFMTSQGFLMAKMAFQYNERMSTPLGTPLVIPYLFIPIGFGALGLQFLAEILKRVSGSDEMPAD